MLGHFKIPQLQSQPATEPGDKWPPKSWASRGGSHHQYIMMSLLRIDTGDSAWKAFDAKQALLDNTSCGYIHVVYNK